MVQEEGQRKAAAGKVEDLGGDVSVEQVDDVDGEVSLQPGDVTDSAVHHLQDFRTGEDFVQQGQLVPKRERIDQVILLIGRDLEMTNQGVYNFPNLIWTCAHTTRSIFCSWLSTSKN